MGTTSEAPPMMMRNSAIKQYPYRKTCRLTLNTTLWQQYASIAENLYNPNAAPKSIAVTTVSNWHFTSEAVCCYREQRHMKR